MGAYLVELWLRIHRLGLRWDGIRNHIKPMEQFLARVSGLTTKIMKNLRLDTIRSSTASAQRDNLGISAERVDVFLDPMHRQSLIPQTKLPADPPPLSASSSFAARNPKMLRRYPIATTIAFMPPVQVISVGSMVVSFQLLTEKTTYLSIIAAVARYSTDLFQLSYHAGPGLQVLQINGAFAPMPWPGHVANQ
ncbi:hypothetical protein AB5N19_00623 [Seiridium cardinale]